MGTYMATDNGIYILVSPTKTGGVEYRVAHCMVIENIYDDKRSSYIDDDGVHVNEYYKVLFFGNSKVHTVQEDAWRCAFNIEAVILSSEYPIIDYGIATITDDTEFPKFTREFAEKRIQELTF